MEEEEEERGSEELQSVAEAAAQKVLNDYKSLPSNGKPLPSQFTVLSGIVACIRGARTSEDVDDCRNSAAHDDYLTICMATGTKCLGSNAPLAFPGCTLADSHAEVLCRRAFNRYLLKCMLQIQHDESYELQSICPLERVMDQDSGSLLFHLKDNWEFWMYISDSPCGDASIYERKEEGTSFTGKKTCQVWELKANSSSALPDVDKAHELSATTILNSQLNLPSLLRTKPARRDIKAHLRSSSMSCSDKFARWMSLGMEGGLLAPFLQSSIYISGLVVGEDSGACQGAQLSALNRSLRNRVTTAFETANTVKPVVPYITLTTKAFTEGKCHSENNLPVAAKTCKSVSLDTVNTVLSKRQQKKAAMSGPKLKPSGTNLNWILNVPSCSPHSKCYDANKTGSVEVTLSSTGIKQGCTVTALVTAKNDHSFENEFDERIGSTEVGAVLKKRRLCDMPTVAVANRKQGNEACGLPFRSRLCRREMGSLAHEVEALQGGASSQYVKKSVSSHAIEFPGNYEFEKYYDLQKKQSSLYCIKRQEFLKNFAFQGWLTDNSGGSS